MNMGGKIFNLSPIYVVVSESLSDPWLGLVLPCL